MTTDFQGLQWKRLDLHFHTPGSGGDYRGKGATPESIISKAKEIGLDAFAVTDHNTGSWVDTLKTAAQGSHLVVFPGVEITVMGGERNVHVLAIFDPSKGTAHVHDFLAQIGITEEKRGQKDALATGDVNQVINKITEADGVALLAHCDSTSGVTKEMKGQARISIIQNQNLLGAEITKDETVAFFNGEDPNYQRRLACVKCSDSHSIDEIGCRSSYFKIGTMSIGALRQCFYDPQTRIRIVDPPNAQCPMILELHVDQGFFNGLCAKFHPGMNAILGGKGVGKSLVVEFLRFVLNQPSDVADIQTDLKSKLENQLGIGGTISVLIKTASGTIYKIERRFDGDTNPVQATDLSDASIFMGDMTKLFPVLAYSQNEVIDISRDANIQLRLIDRLVDLDRLRRPIQEAKESLASNDEEYVGALLAKDKIQELDASIATINGQIKELDNTLNDPMYKDGKNWNNKVTLANSVSSASKKLRQQVEQAIDPKSVTDIPALAPDEQDPDLKGYRDKVSGAADDLVSSVKSSLKVFDDALELAQKDHSEFDKKKSEWDKKFEEFLKTAGGQQEALSKQRDKLAQDLAGLASQREEFALKASAFENHRVNRETLLDALDKAQHDLYSARTTIYDGLTKKSEERLKLTLEPSKNRQAFLTGLNELTHGMSISQKFKEQLVEHMLPREFASAVLRKDKGELETKGLLTSNASAKIVDSVAGNEALLRQLLSMPYEGMPEDVPNIQYKKEDGLYYPLTQLSVGQKCTALLLIALSEGSMPIVIDQPEDALDVATVYHDIVQRLRQSKDQRQFVITTHNANVAVSSDSDMFHVLKGTATSGEIVCTGAIDLEQVARQVVDHLEGGVEPYKLRGRKYNVK